MWSTVPRIPIKLQCLWLLFFYSNHQNNWQFSLQNSYYFLQYIRPCWFVLSLVSTWMGDRLGPLGAVGVTSFLLGPRRRCACESQQQRAVQSEKIILHQSNPRLIRQFCTSWPSHQPRKVAVYVSLSQCLSSPLFHGGSSVRFNIKISCVAEHSAVIQLCHSTEHHLKSFTHSRINLSPFTKDFRVWET